MAEEEAVAAAGAAAAVGEAEVAEVMARLSRRLHHRHTRQPCRRQRPQL